MSKLTSALSLARFNLVKIVVAPYAETNINVGCFTRLDITVMAFDLDPIVRPKNFAATTMLAAIREFSDADRID